MSKDMINKIKNINIITKKYNFKKNDIREKDKIIINIIKKKITNIDKNIADKIKNNKIKIIMNKIYKNSRLKLVNQNFRNKIIKKFPLTHEMNDINVIYEE